MASRILAAWWTMALAWLLSRSESQRIWTRAQPGRNNTCNISLPKTGTNKSGWDCLPVRNEELIVDNCYGLGKWPNYLDLKNMIRLQEFNMTDPDAITLDFTCPQSLEDTPPFTACYFTLADSSNIPCGCVVVRHGDSISIDSQYIADALDDDSWKRCLRLAERYKLNRSLSVHMTLLPMPANQSLQLRQTNRAPVILPSCEKLSCLPTKCRHRNVICALDMAKDLNVQPVNRSAVILDWKPSPNWFAFGAKEVSVRVSDGRTRVMPVHNSSVLITGLQTNKNYTFEVKAVPPQELKSKMAKPLDIATVNHFIAPTRNATWSAWSVSECSVACGNGTRNRTRVCIPPQHGGVNCSQLPEQNIQLIEEKCESFLCFLVHGSWGEWGSIGNCSADCGQYGHQIFQRHCDSPAPQYNGSFCDGNDTDILRCYGGDCATRQREHQTMDIVWTAVAVGVVILLAALIVIFHKKRSNKKLAVLSTKALLEMPGDCGLDLSARKRGAALCVCKKCYQPRKGASFKESSKRPPLVNYISRNRGSLDGSRNEVLKLNERLVKGTGDWSINDVNCMNDIDKHYGGDFQRWLEDEFERVDNIIVICTRQYFELWNEKFPDEVGDVLYQRRTSYEQTVIKGRLECCSDAEKRRKIVLIKLRPDDFTNDDLPLPFRNRFPIYDLTKEEEWYQFICHLYINCPPSRQLPSMQCGSDPSKHLQADNNLSCSRKT